MILLQSRGSKYFPYTLWSPKILSPRPLSWRQMSPSASSLPNATGISSVIAQGRTIYSTPLHRHVPSIVFPLWVNVTVSNCQKLNITFDSFLFPHCHAQCISKFSHFNLWVTSLLQQLIILPETSLVQVTIIFQCSPAGFPARASALATPAPISAVNSSQRGHSQIYVRLFHSRSKPTDLALYFTERKRQSLKTLTICHLPVPLVCILDTLASVLFLELACTLLLQSLCSSLCLGWTSQDSPLV